ncbi:glucuronyl hydrolase [Paenibacillus sp. LMG 31461]|uniref:Glucuronyl hydrolase n=1 Tax=Paenibacillus plantarum TaxID=2654975 RepID=A0ABX1XGV6_9BACL|nr:glycoside hydrolase family 88 protein [Paenibacillus plantarum]NOU67661.1 glucuronyl hydrolase [Paenibacillus plantarum]
MYQSFEQEIQRIIAKVDRNMEQYGYGFPHIHSDGQYMENMAEDGSWTGSFWTGMVAIAYLLTEERRYLDYLYGYLPLYQERLRSGYIDHDLGFLYQLYAVVMYRLTGDEVFRKLTIDAADKLLERYNEQGRFIRAWGAVDSDVRRGKIIIDCMMNLPLLYAASKITGDNRYRNAAEAHAGSSRKHLVRSDYSTYHTFDFDPDSGKPIGGFMVDGYANESTWARGEAWGVYGFACSYAQTGDEMYRETAERMADYFLENLPNDMVPMWDFRLQAEGHQLRDCSASVIAASGIFDLAKDVEDPFKQQFYINKGVQLLEALQSYSSAADLTRNGVLSCCYGRTERGEQHLYAIWGDFYYLEALCKATGRNWQLWSF